MIGERAAEAVSNDARPCRVREVDVCRRPGDEAIILHHRGRYVEVSARGLEIWQAFDGTADLAELSARFDGGSGADVRAALVALTQTLVRAGFVTLDSPASSEKVSRVRSPSAQAAPTLLEGYVTFSPVRSIEATYRIVRPAFHPFAVTAAAVVAVAGIAAFAGAPQRGTFGAGGLALLALVLAACASVCLHEAAHALTLRHFGGLVSRAGVGWYWFAPAAFVDTSAAHLLGARERIAVCLAGPAADALCAGISALAGALARNADAASWCTAFASLTYVRLLWNLNPLLETDWYYALTDLLKRPNLRRDGFARFLGSRAAGGPIELIYGASALLYAAGYVFLAVPALVGGAVADWLGPVAPHAVIREVSVAAALAAALSVGASIRAEQRSHPRR